MPLPVCCSEPDISPTFAKKSLGQHFLIREGIIHRILRALDLKAGEKVLEIGPGRGALTLPLAKTGVSLLLVEKDRELAAWLREKLDPASTEILEADFLEVEPAELETRIGKGFKVVSNLPYNVGTAILSKLLHELAPASRLVLMFQKEVGERLLAKPGSKDYGSLSVFTQLAAEVRLVCRVPPEAFRPPPQVESLVLAFELRETPALSRARWESFESFVKAGFAQRRKMLRQNLRPALGGISAAEVEERLVAVGAAAGARAEELSVQQWVELYSRITEPSAP
ncbi:MAG TPA: 16S rRNA (adenine(1518)-N(6)/adenine(1519)-N(6))-dimethyltransferase RsmA, partial [bacterium]|nr:16S rRNA (adenine(1518)-N(6)/adenine(1519)-N(6))-dimethyltransferase RsmA [bacterium]